MEMKNIILQVIKLLFILPVMLQAMLYAAVEQAPSAEVTELEVINRYYARFDEQFFRVCDKELAKINTFFSGNSNV